MAEQSIEIARQNTSDCETSIYAQVKSDGSLRFEGCDVGALPKRVWGDDDHEYWVTVPTSETSHLLLQLLKEKYSGNTRAVEEFRDFCVGNGISHEFMTWT